MSASFTASFTIFLILLSVGTSTLLCGRSIIVAFGKCEAWAIAAVISIAVTLATLGVVV